MREVSVPLHTRNGIDVVAYGNSLHDADSYYLIRAFESEEQMKSVLDDFYASAGWRSGPREAIISRIELSLKSVLSLPQSGIDGLRYSEQRGMRCSRGILRSTEFKLNYHN